MRVSLLIALFALSCSASSGAEVATARPSTVPATTSAAPQAAASRTACARGVLSSFIDAFNAGDAAALAGFFSANEGRVPFQFFATPETPPYGPDLSHVVTSLVAWHAAGERWRIVELSSGDGPSWHGGVDFQVTVERSWRDRSAVDQGKGALDCEARKIFAFGLGQVGSEVDRR